VELQTISNRLPIKLVRISGKFSMNPSVGGLTTGLSSLDESYHIKWMGWPGIIIRDENQKKEASELLSKKKFTPIWYSKEDYDLHYKGFCNKVIWPLFHYFGRFAEYKKKYWDAYYKINQLFCEQIVARYKQKSIVWIHDYHLMLLPKLLREKLPDAKIGFFLHIPFPHYEMFRELPWRKEIIEGLSGADLIGFHSRQYANYYLHAVSKTLNVEIADHRYVFNNRNVHVDGFPMGIDANKFANQSRNPDVLKIAKTFQTEFANQKVVLSVDRLDYTKGIMQRLEAVYKFLLNNKKWRGKISFLNLIVPSRTSVDKYQIKKQEIDELVGRINGEFGTPFWTPIKYFFRSFDFDRLCALYCIADICLVTPFRDGMNLVSKEYVMCKTNSPGILILSEFAGAANQLKDAILINPNDKSQIINALEQSLAMTEEEKMVRMKKMQKTIKKFDINDWAKQFLEKLSHPEAFHWNTKLKNTEKDISELTGQH